MGAPRLNLRAVTRIIACTNLATTLMGIALCRTRRTIEAMSKRGTPFLSIQAMRHGLFWLVAMSLSVGFFGTIVPAAYFVSLPPLFVLFMQEVRLTMILRVVPRYNTHAALRRTKRQY